VDAQAVRLHHVVAISEKRMKEGRKKRKSEIGLTARKEGLN
jgi:hypothetical protein